MPSSKFGSKFFGEERYRQYVDELTAEGTIGGEQLSPEERKEGFKKRNDKIGFQEFVGKVLEKKSAATVTANRASLPGTSRGGALVKASRVRPGKLVPQPATEETHQNLDEILKGIDSILNSLREEEKIKKKEAKEDRQASERQKRKKSEEKLESGLFKGLVKSTEKVLKPVKSLFDKVFDFIKTIIIGRFLVKFIDWMSDDKNREKLTAIGKFLQKTWPALLAAYLLFGNSLGRFITRIIGMSLKFIPKIAMTIARLAAAHPLAAAVIAGAGLFVAGAVIPKLMPGTVDEQERKSAAQPGTAEEKIKKLEEQKSKLNFLEKMQGKGAEIDEQIYFLQTGKTKAYSGGGLVQGFSEGGVVENPGNSFRFFGFSGGGRARSMGTDTVPAMLTPGEFVMSKGAVDRYGVGFMEGLNASGGGTNRPKVFGGTTYASGGGSTRQEHRHGTGVNRQPNEKQPNAPERPTGPSVSGSLKGLTEQDYIDLAYIVSGEAQRGTDDEYGVAAAVLNRVADPAWPNTISAVGSQAGQFEAVYKGLARNDPALAKKLASSEGQAKIAAALKQLEGRDSFKGTSQYGNMGDDDVKFSNRGNFYHYRQQVGKKDPPPSPKPTYYTKFIGSGGPAVSISSSKGPSGSLASGSTSSGGSGGDTGSQVARMSAADVKKYIGTTFDYQSIRKELGVKTSSISRSSRPSSTAAYQQAQASQQAAQQRDSSLEMSDIPSFDAAAMSSPKKIKTLGITV